jgi:hypothetical protein
MILAKTKDKAKSGLTICLSFLDSITKSFLSSAG